MAIRQATLFEVGGPGGNYGITFTYNDTDNEVTRINAHNFDDRSHVFKATRVSDDVMVINVEFPVGYNSNFNTTGWGLVAGPSPKGSTTISGYTFYYS